MKASNLVAAISLAFASALPASVMAITPACGGGDVSGVAVVDCTGYLNGNLFVHDPVSQHYTTQLLGGLGLSSSSGTWIEKVEGLSGSTTFSFATPIYGVTYIGLLTESGGGQASALYKLDAGYSGVTTLSFNMSGLSNAALFATQPVPEPGAAVLLLAGLAVIAVVVRRRSAR